MLPVVTGGTEFDCVGGVEVNAVSYRGMVGCCMVWRGGAGRAGYMGENRGEDDWRRGGVG